MSIYEFEHEIGDYVYCIIRKRECFVRLGSILSMTVSKNGFSYTVDFGLSDFGDFCGELLFKDINKLGEYMLTNHQDKNSLGE